LTVAEHALADEYDRLFWFHATDNLRRWSVVKPVCTRVFLALLSLIVKTNAPALSTTKHRRHQQGVVFRSMPIFTMAYMPGRSSSLGFGSSIRQHRFGGLIQRVGEPSDFAVETATGQSIDGHLDRLIGRDERCFQFGDGDLDANRLKSVRVTIAAFCAALPEVAAGITAPGSTMRFVMTPRRVQQFSRSQARFPSVPGSPWRRPVCPWQMTVPKAVGTTGTFINIEAIR